MVDTESILNQSGGSFEKPEAIPDGTYTFALKAFKAGESSAKKTPFIEVIYQYIAVEEYDDAVSEEQQTKWEEYVKGLENPFTMSRTFYITPNAGYILKAHMSDHFGITDVDDKTFGEMLGEAQGEYVIGVVGPREWTNRDGTTGSAPEIKNFMATD